MSVPKAPTAQLSNPLSLKERETKAIFCHESKGRIESVCLHVCEGTLFSKHRDICAHIKLNRPFVFVCFFLCVWMSVVSDTHWRKGNTHQILCLTVLWKTLFCTKDPFHARLFRRLYIKNMTWCRGLYCDWFSGGFLSFIWLLGTRWCADSRVSCFCFQLYPDNYSHVMTESKSVRSLWDILVLAVRENFSLHLSQSWYFH